jgi:starvation-inducible DNA-binding protein
MTTVHLLKQALADTYALYLKTQNYHWNITGPNFKPLHLMLEEQYTELALAVDTIAERIRALGEKAPASFSQYAAITKITEGNENASAEEMIADLLHSHEQVVKVLKQVDVAADKVVDTGTENIIDDRIQAHQKTLWMLRATLGE